ncbi:C40 family peptidase [Streptomyces violaceusniger]|uniref:NLP/P60 protein n=1 Tax=Streptomyces violaceusniger (strain Tu 4113) TaxID=653045 RepID=G2PH81_STRV4|nr:C40 family peptidase [Streptomyces violaceusniger]AEM88727.1 NLP/P60 protein [Streptomyces violaceusniger Tu 4113]
MNRRRALLAAGLGTPLILIVLVILLTTAAVAALGRDQQARLNSQAAQKTACTRNNTDTTVDTAAVTEQVQAVLSGSHAKASKPAQGLERPQEQIPNAKIIQEEGEARRVPPRGQVIAIATALQESRLRNLSSGDRDSLGLFQQRPSWGTPEQRQDPRRASRKFYSRLLKVKGWQQLPLTEAAQKVQRSGFPDAYAQWEPLATALQHALTNTPAGDGGDGNDQQQTDAAALVALFGHTSCGQTDTSRDDSDGSKFGKIPAGARPDGYQIPADAPPQVRTALRWALDQLGTPYQWGGTCTNPHGKNPTERCDCSSLMQRAYGVAGVKLTRTTYTQVREGRSVSVNVLKPGDLLFTHDGPKGPGHVGMYMGHGLIVHAPQTGDVVRVTKLAAWKRGIVAARRLIN